MRSRRWPAAGCAGRGDTEYENASSSWFDACKSAASLPQLGVASLQLRVGRLQLARSFEDAHFEFLSLPFDAFVQPGLREGDRELRGDFAGDADLLDCDRSRRTAEAEAADEIAPAIMGTTT